MSTRLKHELNALIYPAPDLPGEWIAHCLELDLITQGPGQGAALEMLAEAIELTAQENVNRGQFALQFRSAPREDWQRLKGAQKLVTRIVHLPAEEICDDVTIVPSVASAG